jgi:hypothetical protein
MNQIALNKPAENHTSNCSERIRLAEQELAAFIRAVRELFGSEQAELSAEDWLQEVVAIDGLPASNRDWRQITLKVSTRLATRVNAPSLSTKSQVLRRKKICVFSLQVPQAS